MNRSDIVQEVAQNLDLERGVVDQVVGQFFDIVGLALRCDEEVLLYGFGKFSPRLRRARDAKVPFHNDLTVPLPDRVTVGFIPSPALKRRINVG